MLWPALRSAVIAAIRMPGVGGDQPHQLGAGVAAGAEDRDALRCLHVPAPRLLPGGPFTAIQAGIQSAKALASQRPPPISDPPRQQGASASVIESRTFRSAA